MTGKQNEKFDLRAAPKHKLVRFRKGVVIAGAAIASAGLLGITTLALQAPNLRTEEPRTELYKTATKPTSDGLSALPRDYAQPKTPHLGPPLPGDLGKPILAQQRTHGVSLDGAEFSAAEQRLARQAIEAREAGVFFRIENLSQQSAPTVTARDGPAVGSSHSDAARLTLDPERDQNNQQRKLDFLNERDDEGIYNPHSLQTPVSQYQVMAGSVISASLITGINSDLPGLVTAQVTQNIYDSVTGSVLLIPQGARLIGTYDSVIAFGQSRALLVWQRIVLPNGSSIRIDNLPATDTAGYAGLKDEVDYHTWRLLKGITMATLLGVGTELTLGDVESDLVRALREASQQSTNQVGQRITEKNLNIQPTITIRPGWRLKVIVQRDIVLKPYSGG